MIFGLVDNTADQIIDTGPPTHWYTASMVWPALSQCSTDQQFRVYRPRDNHAVKASNPAICLLQIAGARLYRAVTLDVFEVGIHCRTVGKERVEETVDRSPARGAINRGYRVLRRRDAAQAVGTHREALLRVRKVWCALKSAGNHGQQPRSGVVGSVCEHDNRRNSRDNQGGDHREHDLCAAA